MQPDAAIVALGGMPPEIEPERLTQAPLKDHKPPPVDLAALPVIDLSVVTYNSQQWFDGFFASLAAQDYPLDRINLIVTDHSADAAQVTLLLEAMAALQPRLALFSVEQLPNRGFGAGHNRALAAGTADYILISNIDLTFEADTLVRLVTEALASPGDVASWECRQKPYEHPKTYDVLTQATPWSSAACLLIRRWAFAEVKGFDETFFMYGEDVDLSGRLRARGWTLRYCPQAVVWHHSYAEPGVIKPAQYFGGVLGNAYLRLRYGSAWDILVGLAMQAWLLIHHRRFPGKYRRLLRGYRDLALNAWHFLRSRERDEALFTFRRWDYAPQRDGAFVAAVKPESTPLVSLIVRTYPGRLPLLREALQSIAAQSWRPLEVIVVEDGGNIAGKHCAALQAASDLDVVYYAAPRHGRCYTGNIGLALARGKYIGFLDDDDLLFSDHVETLMGTLAVGAHQLAYAYGWDIETAYPSEGWVPYRENPPRAILRQGFDRARLWRENYIPIQCVLFDRSLYQTYGGFAEELDNLEDWDLWQRFALAGDFVTVPKTTSLYRTQADPAARHRRMQIIHDYYPHLAARQDQMIWTASVGELRRLTGGERVFARNRLLERLAGFPVLYGALRWIRRVLP